MPAGGRSSASKDVTDSLEGSSE